MADSIYRAGAHWLRDRVTEGLQSTPFNNPDKAEGKAVFRAIQDEVDALREGGSGAYILKSTAAELTGGSPDLAHPANTWARVLTGTGAGYYRKSGASGAGSWAFVSDDPAVAASLIAQTSRTGAEAAAVTAVAASQIAIPRILIEGDSIMAANHNPIFGPAFGASDLKGELIWARALFPYFEMDQWADPADTNHYSAGCNVAIGGNLTFEVLARRAAVMNQAPDIVCLCIGINDLNSGRTAAETMGRIEEIVRYYLGLGKIVLLGNIRPVAADYYGGDWSNGSSRMVQRAALNDLIAAFAAATPSVHLVDLASAYSDGASPPRPVNGSMYDGLHPSPTGGFYGGTAWRAALQRIIKRIHLVRPNTPNLISNGALTGTGGTASTGVTGNVAAEWVISRLGGGAGTATAVASKDGLDRQTVVITPGGGSGFDVFQLSREFGGVQTQANRSYKARVQITLLGSAYWRLPYFYVGELKMAVGFPTDPIDQRLPFSGDLTLEFETPVLNATTTETHAIILRMGLDPAAPAPLTMVIHGVWLQEVPDPRPLHGL